MMSRMPSCPRWQLSTFEEFAREVKKAGQVLHVLDELVAGLPKSDALQTQSESTALPRMKVVISAGHMLHEVPPLMLLNVPTSQFLHSNAPLD
jgi:hypothetical protein